MKAFLYKEKSDSLLEVTRNAELQKQLLDLQNKYENDKLILENKQIRLENEKQTYFYLFLFVFILGWASSLSFWLGKGIEQNCCVMSRLLEIIMQLLIDMLVELQNWRM